MLLRKEKDGSAKKGLAHQVVMELVSSLSNNSYRVYTDNYYSLPALFLDLKQKEVQACGTIRNDMKGLSETFKSTTLTRGNNNKKLKMNYLNTI